MKPKIIYTYTDEAPMLATHSLLPIIRAFSRPAGIDVHEFDISLAGRILAAFRDKLPNGKNLPDALSDLGNMVHETEANIIKLPNISASTPQILAAIKELQNQGYPLPTFPREPQNNEEQEIRQRYDQVKGSAVNPVIREGNSDRRTPIPVKNYACKHPHKMGKWSSNSQSHVASMDYGDFYGSEKSLCLSRPTDFRIEHVSDSGKVKILRPLAPLQEGEIIDTAVMNSKALRRFLSREIQDAIKSGILFSVHLKATMMKVSDPVIFGHVVSVFFKTLFDKHTDTFQKIGVNPDLGLADLEKRINQLDKEKKEEIIKDMKKCLKTGPHLAMVDSDKGITNLHFPSDIIIDASMPAAIRNSGQMWDAEGNSQDMKAVIPDRSYAGVYQTVINHCREFGAFDPSKMGSVSNVGLMAQKAEEYGSHDKTFIAESAGIIRLVNKEGKELLSQEVEKGDIFRACQVKDAPIRNWVELGIARCRIQKCIAVFWLDKMRAHDAELIQKVNLYLKDHDTSGLDIRIMAPAEACQFSLKRLRAGKNTISITGNVLRDYLTDLFPIMELGTSAKMLSIVPLMAGGGLFETGAGGSAPKHVQQFLKENHLRWDSLGEFLALAASCEHLAAKTGNSRARILSETLSKGIEQLLENRKSPSRKCGEPDNRGSHYFLARYWAEALRDQTDDKEMSHIFQETANKLAAGEEHIMADMINAQGKEVDIGGYYRPDRKLTDAIMRPSTTFNSIIDSVPASSS